MIKSLQPVVDHVAKCNNQSKKRQKSAFILTTIFFFFLSFFLCSQWPLKCRLIRIVLYHFVTVKKIIHSRFYVSHNENQQQQQKMLWLSHITVLIEICAESLKPSTRLGKALGMGEEKIWWILIFHCVNLKENLKFKNPSQDLDEQIQQTEKLFNEKNLRQDSHFVK